MPVKQHVLWAIHSLQYLTKMLLPSGTARFACRHDEDDGIWLTQKKKKHINAHIASGYARMVYCD